MKGRLHKTNLYQMDIPHLKKVSKWKLWFHRTKLCAAGLGSSVTNLGVTASMKMKIWTTIHTNPHVWTKRMSWKTRSSKSSTTSHSSSSKRNNSTSPSKHSTISSTLYVKLTPNLTNWNNWRCRMIQVKALTCLKSLKNNWPNLWTKKVIQINSKCSGTNFLS